MSTSTLPRSSRGNTLNDEEEADERSHLLDQPSEREEARTNSEDGINRGQCCIYLSALFLFALMMCIILGLRFFTGQVSYSHGNTEYGTALCVFLIIVIGFGNIRQVLLICFTFFYNRCEGEIRVCVEKIFFFVLRFFSTGSFLIDALNSKNSCPLPYNILCCIFAAMQTFYHCSNDSIFLITGKINSVFLTLLIAVNLCVWFDTETIEIYQIFHIPSNSSFLLMSGEKITTNSSDDNLLNDITDTLHPYTTPQKIEYFLMAIELLSSTTENRSNQRPITTFQQSHISMNRLSNAIRNLLIKVKSKKQLEYTLKGCYVFLVTLFVLFAIFVVIVRNEPNEESMTKYYFYYNLIELIFDILQSIFLIIIFISTFPWFTSFHPNIQTDIFVFAICAIAHFLYNFFDAYGAFSSGMSVGGINGIFTISNTIIQTMFLIDLHFNDHGESDQQYLSMMIFLLAINNFGFWMVDSLAQARYPPYAYSLRFVLNDTWWNIFNKIVFPLVIFYRFKAAMFFFEMREKNRHANATSNNRELMDTVDNRTTEIEDTAENNNPI